MLNRRLAVLARQGAFARKGLLLDVSYRAAFVVRLLGGVVPLVFFYFLQALVSRDDPRLASYGGDYFAFVTVGVALTQYFGSALSSAVKEVRAAQMTGVLEATLSTPTSPFAVVLHGAIYHFAFALLQLALILLAAVIGFGLDLSGASWSVFAVGLMCAIAAFLGLTVLAAAWTVHTKSAEPVQLLFGGIGAFVAGAYFPTSVLPEWLQTAAELVPMTHALDVLRAALLNGASFQRVAGALLKLSTLAVASLALGLVALSLAISRGRRDGSLGQY